METYQSTTPFGRRSLTLAHVASQTRARTHDPQSAAHKWHVYQSLCTARAALGLPERALAVLNALLTFHPETMLTGSDLIVFPSNEQLSRRAHGMPASTLRRHLAILVDAGLIIRRDSPNGKRYARRGRDGEISHAFGFDLAPLLVRAAEFERLAEEVLAGERELRLVREKVTLCRRDITKMIATGMEEGVSVRPGRGALEGWLEIQSVFRAVLGRMPRTPSLAALSPIADELVLLAEEIRSVLENHVKMQNLGASESQTERHKQNSKPKHLVELEPSLPEDRVGGSAPASQSVRQGETPYPLGMVLEACPDIRDYARDGIGTWRDLLATALVVRPMLGISPSAWESAVAAMGEPTAAVVIAAILQRSDQITSAGGYLRELTRKAESGDFSLGRMLMALIGSRKREKMRA